MVPPVFDVDGLGPFRLLRTLESNGSTSIVAREEGPVGFRRDVVLKVVPEGDPAHAAAAAELAREAMLGSRLNHPNIVRTHDFFARNGRLVLVLEHVEGTTLEQLLGTLRTRGERLSDHAALHIGIAVLEALAHAHAQVDAAGASAPIFHMRVTPAAVSLGQDGTVKLGAFSAPPEQNLFSSEEASGSAPPTPQESVRADVRAAGLLLWELLTGREPTEPLEPLAVVRSDLPRELTAAVGAALDATGAKRAVGCAELVSWIKKVARVAGGRDEVRERVALHAPMIEPDPPPAELTGESARIPLQGWTVRLAPIANKVFSVSAGLPKAHAHLRRMFAVARSALAARWPKTDVWLRTHRRASIAIAVGLVAVLVVFVMARGASPKTANTALTNPAPPMPAPVALASAVPAAVPEAVAPPPFPPTQLAPAATPPMAAAKAVAASEDPPSAAESAQQEETAPSEPALKVAAAANAHPPKPVRAPPKGFGYLTVHSSIKWASIYVQLVRYGQVEQRHLVRCGKRFLSLGTPKPQGGEPIWFAPSRTVDIPCGTAVEITMNPKWIPPSPR